MNKYKVFTSEFVGNGHPDKLCDLISDTVLTYCLENDKSSRVAVETMAKDNTIVLGGEVTTNADLSDKVLKDLVKNILVKVGYTYEPTIINLLNEQSPDIALGTNDDIGGAGDQGIMFGYACNDTSDYMPMSYSIARSILRKLEFNVLYDDLGPDMKSQVSYDYETNSVLKVLVSVQHKSDKDHDYVYDIVKRVVGEVLDEYKVGYDSIDSILLVNPTGRFVIGGPEGDCGVTGRKIVVDSYGAKARVGGGAYSGKDPTKVDRSAAYMCRYIAKNIVMSGICNECEVYLSYAIGIAQPFSLEVVTDNKLGSSFDKILSNFVSDFFDLSPREIISYLNLKDLNYVTIDMGNIYGDNVLGINQPWEEEEPVFGARLKKLFLKELNK